MSVPLDASVHLDDAGHVLEQTGLTLVIADHQAALRLLDVLKNRQSLKAVVAIPPRGHHPLAPEIDAEWHWLDEVSGPPESVVLEPPEDPRDLFSIVYTSGSTGHPKGVMLTHARWTQTLRDALGRDPLPRLTLNYLPLSHMAGRINLHTTLMGGGVTNFLASDDMSSLLEDLRRTRPTHMLLVPRVSGLLYQHFQTEMMRRGRLAELERMLGDPVGKQVCQQMRQDVLGGRLCFVHIGAAPTPPEVTRFMRDGLNLHVTDLYGSTEMGPVAVNGRLHDYIAYKLVDRPELGYSTADKPYPRGELAVKSPRATEGYYRNEQASLELNHEGYLLTGDIVEDRGQRQLLWLDRRHSVLRLANGEFVNVSRLEELYQSESPFLEQVYLYGNAWHSYIVAVLVPSASLREKSAAPDEQRQLLRQELSRVAGQSGLRGHEIPRDFLVEPEPFSQANGLLSGANKPRRPKLKEAYGKQLEALLGDIEGRQKGGEEEPEGSGNLPETVREALIMALGLDPSLDEESSFLGLGGDSLSALRLSDLLERSAGLRVAVADLLDPTTPLVQLLRQAAVAEADQALERTHGREASWANLQDFSRLLDGPEETHEELGLEAPSIVLLTGGTGFLGRFLLLELCERLPAGGRVICLVRAENDAAARHRLLDSFASPQGRDSLRNLEEGRLEVLAGDLARPHLGLGPRTFERLSREVQAIVHCGALVNHHLDYPHLFAPNVMATAELIRLARAGQPKALHFISTAGLGAGRYGRNPATERDSAAQLWPRRPIESQAGAYAQGYVTSKWAGEVLVQEAHRRYGLPVTVSRCSLILPHATWPGELNSEDMLARLLYGIWQTQLAPTTMNSPQPMDGLAVDRVASFVAALACQPSRGSRIFHVCHSGKEGMSLDEVVERASQIWVCRRLEPPEFWPLFRQRLEELDSDDKRLSPLAILDRWEKTSKSQLRLDNSAFLARQAELCPGQEPHGMTEEQLMQCVRSLPAHTRPDHAEANPGPV